MSWIEQYPSPHHSSRQGVDPEATVIHYTGGGGGARRWFANPTSNVSAQYVIERSGKVWQCVPLDRAAWHAGRGELYGRGDLNRRTIGIELENWGHLAERNGRFYGKIGKTRIPYQGPDPVYGELHYPTGKVVRAYWEPYTPAQYETLGAVLGEIRAAGYADAAACCVGHCETAGERKQDPGPLFDWSRVPRRFPPSVTSPIHCGPAVPTT